MDEQKKYEVIKCLVDHPDTGNKNRAAVLLGCIRRHLNWMIRGYKQKGEEAFCKSEAEVCRQGCFRIFSLRIPYPHFATAVPIMSR